MTTALATTSEADAIERVLISGDLEQLRPEQRIAYYRSVCESVGLNPLTQPFEYIKLNGKLRLYARKDCTDQLRKIHAISVAIVAREKVDEVYVVTARTSMPNGRQDESIGAVPLQGLKGENLANALMKAETKAKRRATLSICGLGMLDETEVDSVPSAQRVEVKAGPPKTLEEAVGEPKPSERMIKHPETGVEMSLLAFKLEMSGQLARAKSEKDCTDWYARWSEVLRPEADVFSGEEIKEIRHEYGRALKSGKAEDAKRAGKAA